jgi:hypothetical protein
MTVKYDQQVWIVELDDSMITGRIVSHSVSNKGIRVVAVQFGCHTYWYTEGQAFESEDDARVEIRRRRVLRALGGAA